LSPNKEEEFVELDLKRILEKYIKEREAKEDWKTESPAILQLEKTKGKAADLRHLTEVPEEQKQVSTQKEQVLSTEKQQLKEDRTKMEFIKSEVSAKSFKEEEVARTPGEKKETFTPEIKEKPSLTFSELEANIMALGSSNRIIETFFADSLIPTKAELSQKVEPEKPEFFVFGYPNKVTAVIPVVTPEVENELVFVIHLTEKMPLKKVKSIISELNQKLDNITKVA
jgi:hypothetical protein